jgi:uncharacterized protein
MTLQSVDEGVLVTANVRSLATGECGRCLDPVEIEVDQNFMELYEYDEDPRQARKAEKKKKKAAKPEELSEEDDETRHMVGELIDLEGPIRDAIILNLPINPLCRADCQGLCQECGAKWSELPEEHTHEVIDPRWAGLSALKELKNLNLPENGG